MLLFQITLSTLLRSSKLFQSYIRLLEREKFGEFFYVSIFVSVLPVMFDFFCIISTHNCIKYPIIP